MSKRPIGVVEPQAVDFPFVVQAGKREGMPLQNRRENTAALMRAYKARARYNLMRHSLEIEFPGLAVSEERRNNTAIAWMRYAARRWGLNPDKALEDVLTLAGEYHPALEWIQSRAWDGDDRIPALVATVRTGDKWAPEFVRTWLLQAAAALVVGDEFRPEGVLTFQGQQGCGKTQWVRSLVPVGLNNTERIVRIGCTIDPHNKDSVEQAIGHWICELGEVDATFRKSDVASLKAFLDLDRDTFRKSYARAPETYPRRTAFFASVNKRDFLADMTGNRRWWVVAVDRCEWRHEIDTQQLWAQCVALVRGGVSWRMSDDVRAALTGQNERFIASDALREDILSAFRPDPDAYGLTLDDVCRAVGLGDDTAHHVKTRVARAMGELGFARVRKRRNGKRVFVYAAERAVDPEAEAPDALYH